MQPFEIGNVEPSDPAPELSAEKNRNFHSFRSNSNQETAHR
jgi:hypothetical protein